MAEEAEEGSLPKIECQRSVEYVFLDRQTEEIDILAKNVNRRLGCSENDESL